MNLDRIAGSLLVGSLVALTGAQSPASLGDGPGGGRLVAAEVSSGAEVSYTDDVKPIFEARCVSCHGGTGDDGDRRLEGYLDLTTYDGLMAGSEYGTVVEPGDADASTLVDMIESGDMPEEGDPVPPEEIALIRAWIDEGALNN